MGDELVDLPVLLRAGLSVGVGDGHPLLRRRVHYCTKGCGGFGALREVIELIPAAQGRFEAVLNALPLIRASD